MLKSPASSNHLFCKSAFVWFGARVLVVFAAMVLVTVAIKPGTATGQGSNVASTANVVVVPTEVNFHKDTTMWIYGSGLAPKKEYFVEIVDADGVRTGLSGMTEPSVIFTNEWGAFAASFTLGRFASRGVGGEGIQSLRLLDPDNWETLATAPFTFCAITKRAKAKDKVKVPPFCSR